MDLIGDQNQVVLGADGRERAKLGDRPNGAAGIVWAAKEYDLGLPRQLCAQRSKIHGIAPSGFDQLHIKDTSLVGENDPAEGMIGGGKYHDLVAWHAHCLQDEAQSRNDTRALGSPNQGPTAGHAAAPSNPRAQSTSCPCPRSSRGLLA